MNWLAKFPESNNRTSNMESSSVPQTLLTLALLNINPGINPGFTCPELFKAAADAIAKLLKSDIHNLRYISIDAHGRLIRLSPEIAEQHQLALIDCLEVSAF
ncbi:hypothetical protein L1887_04293 [Cichorium endivia]|nr:hypothetical protein L1887_04293 [Cichorium endivia]